MSNLQGLTGFFSLEEKIKLEDTEGRDRALTETVTIKPELRDVLPTSQTSIPWLIYVKRYGVYQFKIIYKDYMNFIYWNCGRKKCKDDLRSLRRNLCWCEKKNLQNSAF